MKEERLRLTSLRYERTTTLPYWGRVWEDAACRGCHSLSLRITNGHRPIYRSVLAVGPHSEHALSQATFWASQALTLLQTGRNAHSSLEPKVPLPTPSCPPGLCLSVYLLTCLLACPPCRCRPAALLRGSVRMVCRPKRGSFAAMRTKVRLARAVGTMQE